ncbi:hypothetical protein J1N10_11675 [Carboxylicivirga sp. A043]|uniref:hypothetical protein n=1 Tax=Carboxylicivirga litoralis TaxID=2816963 RepID=UPI0021CAFB18|nr:hypothetical protein [Carboxylicivirga sp. A043]MCU4156637.1 hypothetical protein [Carboxylicivirga sp. A043]
MKKSHIILLLMVSLVGIFTLTSLMTPQEPETPSPNNSVIMVRTFEIYGMKPSSMVTIYEDGTVEKEPLGKLNASKPEQNLLAIHAKINEIETKGYTLVSTTGGNSDNVICTTFIFKK